MEKTRTPSPPASPKQPQPARLHLGSNAFILFFLALLLVTFATDAHFWPFMAYDMYSSDPGSLQFTGSTKTKAKLDIEADKYFRYYKGHFFDFGLIAFHAADPGRFSAILHTLRERYNESATQPVDSVSVTLRTQGHERFLGEYF